MQQYTFDQSHALGLALTANDDLSAARYVPLAEAPIEKKTLAKPYLRQLHAIANSVACGVAVRMRMKHEPDQWDRLR